MSNTYSWAVNLAKLNTAKLHVTEKAKIDPSVIVDEETIKAEYIKLLGLVRETDTSDDNDWEEETPKPRSKKTR